MRPKDPSFKPHHNITIKRLGLDFVQFLRIQRPLVRVMGPPFQRSRRYVEIDITYRCNLKCRNCNRSCTQAPTSEAMEISQIESFIQESIAADARWERIRLLGGEPTLHPDFVEIVDRLLKYRARHNPNLRIVCCTNGSGRKVQGMLSRIPGEVIVKNTAKDGRQRLFRPFNRAPADLIWNRFADYACGCRIIHDCGIGLTPRGYYMCAIAGGIDRIFGLDRGRRVLPLSDDTLSDQMQIFCPLCGHFGFQWPAKRAVLSKTWRQAYTEYNIRYRACSLPGHCSG